MRLLHQNYRITESTSRLSFRPRPCHGRRKTSWFPDNFSYGDRIDYVLLVKGGAWSRPRPSLSVNNIANIKKYNKWSSSSSCSPLSRLARFESVNNDPVITGMMTVGLILIKQSSSHISPSTRHLMIFHLIRVHDWHSVRSGHNEPPVKCDPTSLTSQPQALSFFPLLTITGIEVMYSNKISYKHLECLDILYMVFTFNDKI